MGKDKDELKAAKGVWGRAAKRAEEGGGASELEDGKYSALLDKAKIQNSQSGNKMVVLEYKVLAGESKGEKAVDFRVVGEGDEYDEEKLGRFFAFVLKPLGMEYPDGEEAFEDTIKLLNKKKFKVAIKVKTNGEYKNTNIEKIIGEDEINDAGGSEETGSVELEIGMKVVAKIDGDEKEVEIVKILEEKEKVKVKDEDDETHIIPNTDILRTAGEDKDDKEEKNGDKKKEAEPEFDDMDKADLKEFIEDNDLEDEVDATDFKDVDDLREAVKEAYEKEQGDGEGKGGVELEKGMKVEFKNKKGKTIEGTVYKVDEDAAEAIVKDEDDEKHTVAFADIEVVEEKSSAKEKKPNKKK